MKEKATQKYIIVDLTDSDSGSDSSWITVIKLKKNKIFLP